MDKSFNDQELSDIMKEIEALEEEFTGEEDTEKLQASAIMKELAEIEIEDSVPTTKKQESTVLEFNKKATPKAIPATKTATSMTFKVQGELNLELQFEVGGKTIMLEVSETGLNIQMEGGVKFSVPVSAAQSLKKAV